MKVLTQRIPSGFIEMNRQALELGLEMGQGGQVQGQSPQISNKQ
jgi:hypothetical protein